MKSIWCGPSKWSSSFHKLVRRPLPHTYHWFCSAMMTLYSIEAFVQQMEPEKEFSNQLKSCIGPSVSSWFSILKTRVMPSGGVSDYNTSHPMLLVYIRMCSQLRSWLDAIIAVWTERAKGLVLSLYDVDREGTGADTPKVHGVSISIQCTQIHST